VHRGMPSRRGPAKRKQGVIHCLVDLEERVFDADPVIENSRQLDRDGFVARRQVVTNVDPVRRGIDPGNRNSK